MLHWKLEEAGFEVSQAPDGGEGLTMVEREQPHVILLDLMMPGLNGIGFLARIDAQAPTPPPIVLYTAYLEPSIRPYAAVFAVVHKPAPFPLVLETLQASIRNTTPVV
jgi:two-component system response regulator (stage 0 sporulation protein F)